MEAATTLDQLHAIDTLIDEVKLLGSRLRTHIIEEPDEVLKKLVYNGLAPDIVAKYRSRFYSYDVETADKIIRYINSEFIPYLEAVRADISGMHGLAQ